MPVLCCQIHLLKFCARAQISRLLRKSANAQNLEAAVADALAHMLACTLSYIQCCQSPRTPMLRSHPSHLGIQAILDTTVATADMESSERRTSWRQAALSKSRRRLPLRPTSASPPSRGLLLRCLRTHAINSSQATPQRSHEPGNPRDWMTAASFGGASSCGLKQRPGLPYSPRWEVRGRTCARSRGWAARGRLGRLRASPQQARRHPADPPKGLPPPDPAPPSTWQRGAHP
jgi:hypothetical protein